ncbi:hypothetical protein FPV25_03155 [Carnobacterium sp. PL17GRE32]|uniref:hypothetical protein n=1 Tax=Carnobacterium sp. PL17GRE32 TaxID=2592355 RepID=UPI0011ECF310|nr:hypothetical protein [Carnobacterium sp. PL17GRE32]KAF3306027.1 hypothetical protein FPV25_03155 [Carnobacterium sp. PL17GRE32]
MPNVLEYSKIFQPSLDKQVVQESTTGWMEANANLVKYNGGNEVKLPNILMDGLADYDRTTGFVGGDVTLEWKTYTLTQDRGRTFSIDAMDVDETNFVVTAGTVMGEFQRTMVVPEIDAYRYSKLATLAIDASQTRSVAVTATDIVDQLLADLNGMEDVIGAKEVVITMNPILAGQLAKAGKDYISKAMLAKGALSVEVQSFNDNAIVKAPSKLLKTAFEFNDGTTVGQEVGGFKAAAGALDINWLISTKDAPIAISKTDKVRTFAPDTNQKADAWKIDYRKYHDLWVPASKLTSIYANTKPAV